MLDRMNSLMFKLSCVFGLILLAGCKASFISFPRNEMAVKGESVEFECSTDSEQSLRWSFIYYDMLTVADTTLLFARGNLTTAGTSRYRITTRSYGQYNLVIDSVDFSYAGKYKCTDGSFGPEVEAELAVIDSQLLCQTNASSPDNIVIENDYLWMQCSLRFSGSMHLSLSWIRNNTGNVIRGSFASNGRNESVIVVQVNSIDNGETFTINATFTQENNSRQIVVTWNYTITVFYATRNLVIKPNRSVYKLGDRIECSADGNPFPTYQWTDIEADIIRAGSILTIDDYIKPDQNHTFRCTANNTVMGIPWNISDTITFSVAGHKSAASVSSAAIITSVVTVILLCICIGIAVLICRRQTLKAWASRLSEPDVISNDLYAIHYYDIVDLSNERAVGSNAMPGDDVVRQTEPAFSEYELVRGEDNATLSGGVSLSPQVGAPAYSKVNKKDREKTNRETQMTSLPTPVYSEIAKKLCTSKTQPESNAGKQWSTKRKVQQKNYFGDDGTEYTRVESLPEERPATCTSPPKPPRFRPVDNYAPIDHTQRAPPPPPRL